MAYAGTGQDLSFIANEDLSDMQYRFVRMQADDRVQMLNAGSDFPLGILQNDPESGEVAVVRVSGVSKLVVNASVSRGDDLKAEYVGASDNGKGDAVDTSGDICRAIALTSAGAEDDVVSALLVYCKDTDT